MNTTPNQEDLETAARFFDQNNKYWSHDPEYNKIYLMTQQNFMNDLLQSRGIVFLNEVYTMLGIPMSRYGATHGWAVGLGNENRIDIGISDVMMNTDPILLRFNVDGDILSYLD